jgi:putative transposase
MSAFIDAHRARFGVEPICRVLGVASSGYYARAARVPAARARADAALLRQIRAARAGYRAAYGARRTWIELGRRGIRVGRDRVARLMAGAGLQGVLRGRRRVGPAAHEPAGAPARDLVRRRFVAARPNRLWVADLTQLATRADPGHLAFVLDVYGRRVVGWQLGAHPDSALVLEALEMAVALRRPHPGLVAHTDRGTQYTSIRYTDRLAELGILASLGSAGDAYDNAMAEAFLGTLKAELVGRRRFSDLAEVERAILAWIGFYNHERLHGALGHRPPAEYEQRLLGARTPGPLGPGEAGRPALSESAPAGLATPVFQ